MKIVVYIYSIIVIVVCLFFTFMEYNAAFRIAVHQKIFSYGKDVQEIQSNSIGYSFESHTRGTHGSVNYYDYLYCFEYKVNDSIYLGKTEVYTDKNREFTGYLPLPKTISVLVNKNKPNQFFYSNKKYHYSISFCLLYIAFAAFFIYGIKQFKSSDFIPEIRKENSIGDSIKALWFILLSILPTLGFVIMIISIRNGEESDAITNHTIVMKKPLSEAEIEKLKNSRSNLHDLFIHRNLDVSSDKLDKLYSIATLENFADKEVYKCYVFDRKNNKIDIQFKYNENDLDIILKEDILLKNFNFYIISKQKKYLLPLDIITKNN